MPSVLLNSFFAHAGQNPISEDDRGTYTIYTTNAWLTVSGSSQLLMIYQIKFKVYDDGTNSLYNTGYVNTVQTSANNPLLAGKQDTGTTSDPAYVEHSALFDIEVSTGGEPEIFVYIGTLHIEAGSNGTVVEGY